MFVEYTKLVVTPKKESTVETYLKKKREHYITFSILFYGFDFFLVVTCYYIYIYYLETRTDI